MGEFPEQLDFIDLLKKNISVDDLARVIADNARNKNIGQAYKYVEMLVNLYGVGTDNLKEVTSSFEGYEKDSLEDWEPGE